jgi:hypothetical protein
VPGDRQIRLPAHLAPEGYAPVLECPDAVSEQWRAAVAALARGRGPMVSRYLHNAVVCARDPDQDPRFVFEACAGIPTPLADATAIRRLLSDPEWGSTEAADGNLWRLFRTTFVVLSHLLGALEPPRE